MNWRRGWKCISGLLFLQKIVLGSKILQAFGFAVLVFCPRGSNGVDLTRHDRVNGIWSSGPLSQACSLAVCVIQ